MKNHNYSIGVSWTGNLGVGTQSYTSYLRDHLINGNSKYAKIQASSDPVFRGDRTKYNPEELFVASISSCHMLWYLHLCSANGITVTEYSDEAQGIMQESTDEGGRFVEVTLYPQVTIVQPSKIEKASDLHHEAHKLCFIANSCNFPIRHIPTINIAHTQT